MSQNLEQLKQAILTYDAEGGVTLTRAALEEGASAVEVAGALTGAIRVVGDAFGRGDIFLPELVAAANAGKAAMNIIEEVLTQTASQRESAGTFMIGTVAGDIHDIGKNIVAALFFAAGFKVIDLGVDISSAAFVEAVEKHSPDILGMSALLTTTAPAQKKVVADLAAAGLRDKVKIIVGGAAISHEFAREIGADGYGATAFEAVSLADRLLGRA